MGDANRKSSGPVKALAERSNVASGSTPALYARPSSPPSPPKASPPAFTLTPIVDDGLFMLVSEHLLIVRIDQSLTAQAFERYTAEWLTSVDRRLPTARVGAFYDIPAFSGCTAGQRREWAAMLKSREEVLRRTTVAMVLATPSPLVRGALHAIYWLAPPPFPYSLCSDVEMAWKEMAKRVSSLDPTLAVEAYRTLLRRYVPPRTVGKGSPSAGKAPSPPARPTDFG